MKSENQNLQKQNPCLFHGLGSKWHRGKLLKAEEGTAPPHSPPTLALSRAREPHVREVQVQGGESVE